MSRAAVCLALSLACSGTPELPKQEPPPVVTPPVAEVRPDEPTTEVRQDEPTGRPAPRSAQGRAGRPIEIVLRSSPPGAVAAVDGIAVGPTPAYWAGSADGRAREFTFALSGHAPARYRFVPITSGVVHARLEVIVDDEPGARPSAAAQPAHVPSQPASQPAHAQPVHAQPVHAQPAPTASPAQPEQPPAGQAPQPEQPPGQPSASQPSAPQEPAPPPSPQLPAQQQPSSPQLPAQQQPSAPQAPAPPQGSGA